MILNNMGKTTQGLLYGALAGFLVGLAGARKDAPYEGFKINTFWRSPLVGALAGVIVNNVSTGDKTRLFLGSIAVERMIVEGYKLLRAQKPGKFEFGEWGIQKPQLT
jgi:hypothetical protein